MPSGLQAQEITWYTDVDEAVDVASQEGKMVFHFAGSSSCGYCNMTKDAMNTPAYRPELKQLILDNYVVVFVEQGSPGYYAGCNLPGGYFPHISILDPNTPSGSYDYTCIDATTGDQLIIAPTPEPTEVKQRIENRLYHFLWCPLPLQVACDGQNNRCSVFWRLSCGRLQLKPWQNPYGEMGFQ